MNDWLRSIVYLTSLLKTPISHKDFTPSQTSKLLHLVLAKRPRSDISKLLVASAKKYISYLQEIFSSWIYFTSLLVVLWKARGYRNHLFQWVQQAMAFAVLWRAHLDSSTICLFFLGCHPTGDRQPKQPTSTFLTDGPCPQLCHFLCVSRMYVTWSSWGYEASIVSSSSTWTFYFWNKRHFRL